LARLRRSLSSLPAQAANSACSPSARELPRAVKLQEHRQPAHHLRRPQHPTLSPELGLSNSIRCPSPSRRPQAPHRSRGHATGIIVARWRRAAIVPVARGGRSVGFPVARRARAAGLPVAFVSFRSRVSRAGARRLGGGRLDRVEAWGRPTGVSRRGCAPAGGRSEPERRRRLCPRRRPNWRWEEEDMK
jgi:hypothetical protein